MTRIEVQNFCYALPSRTVLRSKGKEQKFTGRVPFLSNLNFTVESGEHLALVGPNGAGKTTLLRALDLILTDWTGTILLDGRSIRDFSRKELARRMAFIRQNSETVADQTVRSWVTTGRYPYLSPWSPLSPRDERVIETALLETETADFADRRLSTLSGGERARVFLAAALAQEPSVLLLDESAAFLDYRHQSEMNRLLDKIRRQRGTTLIEVTHDLNRAVLCGAHVIALANGGIRYNGPAEEMMNQETLRAVFQTDLELFDHPIYHKTLVIPR